MVYCGKASEACQHCRTRRIKCDKKRPECSQCVRASKSCPGYRDQLSLMFRDESTKVIQRAQAQWGGKSSSDSPGPSSSSWSSSTTSPSSANSPTSPALPSTASGPGSPGNSRRTTFKGQPTLKAEQQVLTLPPPRIPKAVQSTLIQKGTRFYIEHYLIGYPQEPKSGSELSTLKWISSPALFEVMAAVGLSGLANLTSDSEMATAAQQKYGIALRNTARMISNPALNPASAVRSVVLLAMFEVVRGHSEAAESLRTHITGAAALLSALASGPMPNAMTHNQVFRAIALLCFSMLIPCHSAGVSLPSTFFDWIRLSQSSLTPEDKPATELILITARFIQLSSQIKTRPSSAPSMLAQVLELESELDRWEEQRQEPDSRWVFATESAVFPPEAAFRNKYHVYAGGMWTARVWNHYRWARIQVNQTLLDLVDPCPPGISDGGSRMALGRRCLETVARLAEDTLVGLPTHFRHPRLTDEQREWLDRTCLLPRGASGGVGSAGIPGLVMQLKVAASAPGVSAECARWALRVLETVWAQTGMLSARSLADVLRGHIDRLERVAIKVEDEG